MKYQEVIDKVAEIDAQIKALKDERQSVLNSMLDRAPYKVGDTMPVPRRACSHTGKSCRITYAGVKSNEWNNSPYFQFRAVVLKKGGKDSMNNVRWDGPVPED